MLHTTTTLIECIGGSYGSPLDDVLKINFWFQSTRCALRCPGYDRHFYFALLMSMECTNPNLKSAELAQLGQPAPKLKLDLYIP